METSRKIGFIGLGQMGAPMVRNLARSGHELTIYDRDRALTAGLAGEVGARGAAEAAEVGEHTSLVITMLPNSAIVRDVILGGTGPGVADRAVPGTLFIDMSSSAPQATRQLATELRQRDLHLVDAPVSGGVKKAADGTLAIIMGGDLALLEPAKPVLLCMGNKLFHAGPVGAGHAMKALNNYVSAAGLAAAVEAVKLAAAFGIEPTTAVDVLNASTGRNNSTENKFHQFILSGSFASGFSLGLMAKDIGLAGELARNTDAAVPLLECCEALWRSAAEQLGTAADHTEYFRFKPDPARE